MLWIFSIVSFFTNTPNYSLIRQTYQKAITSESHVSTLKNLTESFKNTDATAKAFFATSQAFEAKKCNLGIYQSEICKNCIFPFKPKRFAVPQQCRNPIFTI